MGEERRCGRASERTVARIVSGSEGGKRANTRKWGLRLYFLSSSLTLPPCPTFFPPRPRPHHALPPRATFATSGCTVRTNDSASSGWPTGAGAATSTRVPSTHAAIAIAGAGEVRVRAVGRGCGRQDTETTGAPTRTRPATRGRWRRREDYRR